MLSSVSTMLFSVPRISKVTIIDPVKKTYCKHEFSFFHYDDCAANSLDVMFYSVYHVYEERCFKCYSYLFITQISRKPNIIINKRVSAGTDFTRLQTSDAHKSIPALKE